MMRPISLELSLFKDRTDKDRARSQRKLLWIMEGIVQCCMLDLKDGDAYGRPYPALYESEVVYEEEKKGYEEWQDVPTTIAKGVGDCEDLANWRCAELRMLGIDAHPLLRWREVADPGSNELSLRYHALVSWPDGRVEDPSRALGMTGQMTRRPVFVRPNREYVNIDAGAPDVRTMISGLLRR